MSRRTRAVLPVLVLLGALVLPVAADAQSSPTATSAPRASTPHLAPGRFGALKVGMTARQAVRTGLVRSVDEGEACGHQLYLRKPYQGIHVAYVDRSLGGTGRIELMVSLTRKASSARGIHAGSTYRALRHRYGTSLRGPYRNDYAQHVFDLKQGRRYLSFFFNGRLHPGTKIASMLVTSGRPIHLYEGEGPC